MVGGAAENLILNLRDLLIRKLTTLQKSIPKGLEDWKIRTVSEALQHFFQMHAPSLSANSVNRLKPIGLASRSRFALRAMKPVIQQVLTRFPQDTVHAALLIFPELARLADSLTRWTTEDFG